MSKRIRLPFLVLSLFISVSCSQNGMHTLGTADQDPSKLAPPTDNDSEFYPPPENDGGTQTAPIVVGPTPSYCSKLDIAGVTWPEDLSQAGQAHLGLALNISGSFEGRSGWANLSNNFDGMGFSIGLLQQNLGMGSIQPMLNDMISLRARGADFQLSEAHFLAIKSMVSQWNKDQGIKSAAQDLVLDEDGQPSPFYNDDSVISQYDVEYEALVTDDLSDIAPGEDKIFINSLSLANKNSLNWALKTLYKDGGKTFKVDWSENLTKMAQSKPYVSLQLKYAMKIYYKAFRYFKSFKLSTLSHFLLMFDFVVQNGGFKQRVLDEYALKLKQTPNMSEQDKALLILQLRLRDVTPRWQNDVSARKKAIIFSVGTVHGAKRDLKSEFCYDPSARVLIQP